MKVLKCKLCKKRGITIEYFKHVKDGSGLPPNCQCQLGSGDIGGYWRQVDFIFEDELPEMNNEQYSMWFNHSIIVDGVRMGPRWSEGIIGYDSSGNAKHDLVNRY